MDYRKKETTVVVSQKEISKDIFDLRVKTDAAMAAVPGQFAGIFPPSDAKILMRPISICEADAEKGEIRFVYRIAGEGTRLISGLKEGDKVNLLSVLGNGFPIEATEGKKVAVMGGGIGIPPMLELAKTLNAENQKAGVQKNDECVIRSVMGYRDEQTFLKEDLEKYSSVYPATEDGSVGTKGNVMDAIRENALEADVIFACGPMPMLRAIKAFAQEKQIPAYISLEEHMACGVGACLGCVVKTKEEDHHSHVHNARICTDGPVFEAGEVEI